MKYYYHDIEYHSIEVLNEIKYKTTEYSKENLVRQCTEMAQSSFGSQSISENDVSRHILDSYTTILARDHSNKLCGFSSSTIKKIDEFYIIYFQSTVISNDYKRTGLHKLFLALRIMEAVKKIMQIDGCDDENKILLGGRTQNPRICRRSRKNLGLFPSLDGFIDDRIKSIGRKFAKTLYDEDCKYSQYVHPFIFDDEKFVARSAYKFASNNKNNEGNLYNNNIPFCNDSEVDNFMKSNIDWENGDALVSLGYYKNDKVKNLLDDSKVILERCYSQLAPCKTEDA